MCARQLRDGGGWRGRASPFYRPDVCMVRNGVAQMQQKEVKNNGGARENAQTPNKRKKKQRADAIRGRPPPSLSIAALALQLARRAFFQPPAAPECAYDESPLQLCSRKLRARGEGTPPPPPRGSTPRFPLASAQAQPTTKKINPSPQPPPVRKQPPLLVCV